jgi:hypothetical protein
MMLFWWWVAAVTMGGCAFLMTHNAYAGHTQGVIDNIKKPIYVNLPSSDGGENLTKEPLQYWPFFQNLDDAEALTFVWGYADYQRNLLGFRIDVEYEGEKTPSCAVLEVNDVRYARTNDEHNKLKHFQTVLIMCDSIEEWFKENLNE